MDKFKYIELKNILYKNNLIISDCDTFFEENRKQELYEIAKSYKINTPCNLDGDENSWLNLTIPFHMTVRDLMSMKHGEALEVIFLNKEFMNFDNLSAISNDNRSLEPLFISPKDFFLDKKYNTVKSYIYIHNSSYSGIINFGKEWKSFDWHLEIYDTFKSREEMVKEFGEETINNFKPKMETRLGWKGPCISVKNLEFCPDIIF